MWKTRVWSTHITSYSPRFLPRFLQLENQDSTRFSFNPETEIINNYWAEQFKDNGRVLGRQYWSESTDSCLYAKKIVEGLKNRSIFPAQGQFYAGPSRIQTQRKSYRIQVLFNLHLKWNVWHDTAANHDDPSPERHVERYMFYFFVFNFQEWYQYPPIKPQLRWLQVNL